MDFELNQYEAVFQRGLMALTGYREKYGHCKVPQRYKTANGFALGTWVSNRRNYYKAKRSTLAKKRIKQLKSLGFDWDLHETKFQWGLKALASYRKEYGDCKVLYGYKTANGFKLGSWVSSRRIDYKAKRSSLTKERIRQLEAMGFDW